MQAQISEYIIINMFWAYQVKLVTSIVNTIYWIIGRSQFCNEGVIQQANHG